MDGLQHRIRADPFFVDLQTALRKKNTPFGATLSALAPSYDTLLATKVSCYSGSFRRCLRAYICFSRFRCFVVSFVVSNIQDLCSRAFHRFTARDNYIQYNLRGIFVGLRKEEEPPSRGIYAQRSTFCLFQREEEPKWRGRGS